MDSGLTALALPYFEASCRDVFGGYLGGYGFTALTVDGAGCPVYAKGEVFFRLHYYPEDAPDYSPMVTLGFVSRDPSEDRYRYESIGLWYAIPPDDPAHEYPFWTFRNERELRHVLAQLRDRVVHLHARPLWENVARLRELVDRASAETQHTHREERTRRQRARAEAAFRSGEYSEAREIYEQLDPSSLSPAEQKRLAISRRHLHPT